jgi:hypothetical protein
MGNPKGMDQTRDQERMVLKITGIGDMMRSN